MLSRLLTVLLVFLLTGCSGSTMFGYEEPNVGADEFPSAEELQANQEYQKSLENQRDLEAQQYFTEETMNASDAYYDKLAETELANINQSSGTSGCPSGCDYHKQGCNIKGNISVESGEKIYHVPGGEFYASATVNTKYGEKWFCTEQEAINNGWRKSQK